MNNPTPQQPVPQKEDGTRNIIIGQKVTSVKVQRAKELRLQMTEDEKIL